MRNYVVPIARRSSSMTTSGSNRPSALGGSEPTLKDLGFDPLEAAPTPMPKLFRETTWHRPVLRFDERITTASGRHVATHGYVECACGQRFVVRCFAPRQSPLEADERQDAREHFGVQQLHLSGVRRDSPVTRVMKLWD